MGCAYASAFWESEKTSDEAVEVERGYGTRIRGFSDMQKVAASRVRNVTLNYVRVPGYKKAIPGLAFFLDRVERGVFLLRMTGTNNMKHAICVDNREEPALILDSAEDCPMVLTKSSLKLCVGDDTQFQDIAEARKVVKQGKIDFEKKRTRRRSRSDLGKAKPRRGSSSSQTH